MSQLCERRTHPASGRVDGERGATMVEYCFMVVLIAVVCVLAVGAVGAATNTNFSAPSLLDALS